MSQLLGIDLGTSSVKVLLTTETGQILGRGSAEYAIHHPQPNFAEQDPEDWWQATLLAVRQATAGVSALNVSAIGLSGQMHGTVLLDRAGQSLAPAVIWPDQRSQRQTREIADLIGPERLIELSGSLLVTGFQAATLRWMQQERPELWQKTHRILLPKDYLRWRLTGEFYTDPSDGSGALLLDVHRRRWSTEILTAIQVDATQLPPVQASTAVAGVLSRQAAELCQLPGGIPVITGAADTASGLVGAGIVDAQSLLLTISTGGQIILPITDVEVDLRGRLHTFCGALAPEPGQPGWYQMAAILSAGLALRWLRDQVLGLSGGAAYGQMSSWAETAPVGAGGLLFLPYLVGERTPHMDPLARGLFLGLTARHGRAELVRSVMEGVALACYDAFLVLAELGAEPTRIIMGGGGASSSLWRQIVADVFGLPVHKLEVQEQAALGAVLLAGGGVNLFNPTEMAQKWATYGPPQAPNRRHYDLYQTLFPLFRNAFQKNREAIHRLSQLTTSILRVE